MKHKTFRWTALLLSVCLILALAGCGGSVGDMVADAARGTEPSASATAPAETGGQNGGAGLQTSGPSELPAASQAPEPSEVPEPSPASTGVVLGRSAFVHDSGVAFWCADSYLYTALVDGDGWLYDLYCEGELPQQAWSVAVMDAYLYLGTGDGLYKVDLEALNQGQGIAQKLGGPGIYDGFALYEGGCWYTKDETLYRIDLASFDQISFPDICEYVTTEQGVFATGVQGGLYRISPDGTTTTLLDGSVGGDGHLTLAADGGLYLWYDYGSQLYLYDGDGAQAGSILLPAEPTGILWALPDGVVYQDQADEYHVYDLLTGSDGPLTGVSLLPERCDAQQVGDILYYRYSTSVYAANLGAGEKRSYDSPEAAGAPTEDGGAAAGAPASAGFDMGRNLRVANSAGGVMVANDYFTLDLPGSPAFTVLSPSETSVSFYYSRAYDSSAPEDGWFLTIAAYDWGDNGYADLPSWAIAGLDADKKYVAIFPTDVRFDPGDPVQAGEYGTLLSAAREIDNERTDGGNPFRVVNP